MRNRLKPTEQFRPEWGAVVLTLAAFLLTLSGIGLPSQADAGSRGGKYRIDSFECPEKAVTGDEVTLSVTIKNKGGRDPGTTLTVVGESDGELLQVTPEGGVKVFADPKGGKTTLDFSQTVERKGEVKWKARLPKDDDECTTRVESGDPPPPPPPPPPDGDNTIALHDRASSQYDKHCLDCHGDVASRPTLDTSVQDLTAHGAMLPFAPGEQGSDKQCRWCHRSTRIVQGLPMPHEPAQGSIRKHVDPALCTLCHGPASSGPQFYSVNLADVMTDGAQLYTLVCSSCHGDLADSEVRGESASEIRDEIAEDEGGMLPLEILTDQQIQAIAAALAN